MLQGTIVTKSKLERLKIGLDVYQAILATLGLVALWFAYTQWEASEAREQRDVYRTISKDWNDHLLFFVTKPELRPYFFDREQLTPNDPNAGLVFAVADVRIDLMDAILTHIKFKGWTAQETAGWQTTFRDAFRTSPALCEVFQETSEHYGLIKPVAKEGCELAKADLDRNSSHGPGS